MHIKLNGCLETPDRNYLSNKRRMVGRKLWKRSHHTHGEYKKHFKVLGVVKPHDSLESSFLCECFDPFCCFGEMMQLLNTVGFKLNTEMRVSGLVRIGSIILLVQWKKMLIMGFVISQKL